MRGLFHPVIRSINLLTKHERAGYFSLMAARVVANFLDVAGLAGVGLFGALIAANLTGQEEVSFSGFDVQLGDSQVFLWVILGVVILFLLKSIFATTLLRANGFFLARVESRASAEVMSHIFGGDLARVKRYSQAQIQWAVSSSTAMAFSMLLTSFNVLVTETTLFLFIFSAFAIVDLQTALLITVYFLVLIGLFQWAINRRLVEAGESLASNSKEVTKIVLDLSRAFRELAVLSKVGAFLERFRIHRYMEARTFARVRFFDGSPRFFVETALMLGVMALVGWQFLRGNLSQGLTITAVFMAGGVRMMGALLPLQNAVSWLKVNGPQAKDSQDILEDVRRLGNDESEGEIHSIETALGLMNVEIASSEPLGVVLDKVWFSFPGDSNPTIREVSLSIKPGSFVALVGPSGAGKTTIADLILGLLSPEAGSVSVGNYDPNTLRDCHPGLMSYVPQKPGMVSGSVAENIALGLPPQEISEARVRELLQQVGLLEVLETRDGIFSDMGAHADGLSGGQLQRMGLARALYSNPRLIILDEATSALDAGAEAEVVKAVETLRGEVTVVVIAHRLSTIQRADKVFVVENGEIAGSGSFSEVRRKVQLIEHYVQLMSFDD